MDRPSNATRPKRVTPPKNDSSAGRTSAQSNGHPNTELHPAVQTDYIRRTHRASQEVRFCPECLTEVVTKWAIQHFRLQNRNGFRRRFTRMIKICNRCSHHYESFEIEQTLPKTVSARPQPKS